MKFIIFISLFTISTICHASFVQLGLGGITPHFSRGKKNYCNQWNNTSVIVNKSYYVRFQGETLGMTYLKGNDSICSPIDGIFIHYLMSRSEIADIGITVGGYEYDTKNWDEHAAKTPSEIDAPSTLLTKVGDKDVVPVLALEVGLHLIKRSNWSLKLNNLFTPIIFNHSIAYEYRF